MEENSTYVGMDAFGAAVENLCIVKAKGLSSHIENGKGPQSATHHQQTAGPGPLQFRLGKE